ncbi:hypothetical protein CEXT_330001 [Caerostris extrusa]|uniref:Secreted protein n=1 Tax=Caerostris extrusa TaxID=172846 RepID=A0AAV4XJ49_CAEEX|nr:hypothetical protein CEXT_330001 [Caerostris extrusa]
MRGGLERIATLFPLATLPPVVQEGKMKANTYGHQQDTICGCEGQKRVVLNGGTKGHSTIQRHGCHQTKRWKEAPFKIGEELLFPDCGKINAGVPTKNKQRTQRHGKKILFCCFALP